MTRALLLLALLLTACGAPATPTPAPVPTVPANQECLFQTLAPGAVVAPPTPAQ